MTDPVELRGRGIVPGVVEAEALVTHEPISGFGGIDVATGTVRAFEAGAAWHIDALAIEPVDTTAAGDAFVGVLAATLDDDQDLAAALHRASVAGALACLTSGAQPSLPDKAAIDSAIDELARPRRA